jgi:hypothetical protein
MSEFQTGIPLSVGDDLIAADRSIAVVLNK